VWSRAWNRRRALDLRLGFVGVELWEKRGWMGRLAWRERTWCLRVYTVLLNSTAGVVYAVYNIFQALLILDNEGITILISERDDETKLAKVRGGETR